jgi:hypothetical protein
MSLGAVLLIVMVLLLIGVIPSWPNSRNSGYGPSEVLWLALFVVIVLVWGGRL